MGLPLKQIMDAAQFLAWEDGPELKHEFNGCAREAMTGGSFIDARIKIRLYGLLRQNQRLAEVFFRTETGWQHETIEATGILDMPEIGIAIQLAKIYEGLTLRSDLTSVAVQAGGLGQS